MMIVSHICIRSFFFFFSGLQLLFFFKQEIAEGKNTDELLNIPVYVEEREERETSSTSTSTSSSSKPPSSLIRKQSAKQIRESLTRKSNSTRSFIVKKSHPWHAFWPNEDLSMPLPNKTKQIKNSRSNEVEEGGNNNNNNNMGKSINSTDLSTDLSSVEKKNKSDGRSITGLNITNSNILISMIENVIQKNKTILVSV